MTRISLVRHGQTDWNLTRRIQGSSDIPLNDNGRAQARVTGEILRRRHWNAIYTSPLARARETAEIIASEMGLEPPTPVAGLEERNYGEAEGLTGEEILDRYPDGTAIPGQESREAVVERALPALVALAERHPDEDIVVVSHGAVISSLVRKLSDHTLPPPGEVIANGSIHDFSVHDGRLRLERFNASEDDHDLFTAAVS